MAVKNINSYGYQYGTEAPEHLYGSPAHEPNSPLRPGRKPNKKQKPKIDYAYGMKLTICGGLIFLAAMGYVGLTSRLSEKQMQLRVVTEQIRETQSDINNVQAIIAGELDLERIRMIAETQLDMKEPLVHQIIYLDLQQESYTQYAD